MSNDINFDKAKFIKYFISHLEYNTSSAERARQYLEQEGLNPDEIVASGLKEIREIKAKLEAKNNQLAETYKETQQATAVTSRKKKWTHHSVVRLMQESGNDDPLEEIKSRARELVLQGFEMGWGGPPYSPVELASRLGMEVLPNDNVLDARIVPQKKGFQIQYNPFQKPTRLNFSVAHEIAHTLFTDCGEAIRNREAEPTENRQLEQLCNAAAAEIQLPYAIFSHDANAASPSIEGLIDLATKYKASLESVFIRYTEVIDRPCVILIGIFQSDNKIVVDYYKASRSFPINLPDYMEIPTNSKSYECKSPGWTAREQVQWDFFNGATYNLFSVGISPYRRDKKPRVGMLVLPTESYDLSPEAGKVVLEIGDATKPRGKGKKVIAQVVNTGAALGRGFGYSLAKNHPIVKEELKKWHSNKTTFILGNTNLIKVNEDLYVFQMLAQKGIFPKGNEIPLKYNHLRECLIKLRHTTESLGASIHMPAIGSGNAGGDWNIIIGMIHDELVNYDLKVNIYLFQGKPYNPKEKTTLTIFKEDSTWGTKK